LLLVISSLVGCLVNNTRSGECVAWTNLLYSSSDIYTHRLPAAGNRITGMRTGMMSILKSSG